MVRASSASSGATVACSTRTGCRATPALRASAPVPSTETICRTRFLVDHVLDAVVANHQRIARVVVVVVVPVPLPSQAPPRSVRSSIPRLSPMGLVVNLNSGRNRRFRSILCELFSDLLTGSHCEIFPEAFF